MKITIAAKQSEDNMSGQPSPTRAVIKPVRQMMLISSGQQKIRQVERECFFRDVILSPLLFAFPEGGYRLFFCREPAKGTSLS